MKLVATLLVVLTLASTIPAVSGAALKEEDNGATTPSELDAACPTSLTPGVLTSGVGVTGTIAAVAGAACYYTMATDGTSGAVRATLTGLPADFDLYIRMAGTPTTLLYDCRPFTGGTTSEACTVLATSGTAHIMVRRFTGSGDFTITSANHVIPVLNDGPAQFTTFASSMEIFKLNVAAGNTQAAVSLAGDPCRKVDATTPPGTADPCLVAVQNGALAPLADADLYVRVGAFPTTLTTGSSCRVVATGIPSVCAYSNEGSPVVGNPDASVQTRAFAGAGTYYVGVRGTVGTASGVVAGATA